MNDVGSQAKVIGAPLEVAINLYPKLQKSYLKGSEGSGGSFVGSDVNSCEPFQSTNSNLLSLPQHQQPSTQLMQTQLSPNLIPKSSDQTSPNTVTSPEYNLHYDQIHSYELIQSYEQVQTYERVHHSDLAMEDLQSLETDLSPPVDFYHQSNIMENSPVSVFLSHSDTSSSTLRDSKSADADY